MPQPAVACSMRRRSLVSNKKKTGQKQRHLERDGHVRQQQQRVAATEINHRPAIRLLWQCAKRHLQPAATGKRPELR